MLTTTKAEEKQAGRKAQLDSESDRGEARSPSRTHKQRVVKMQIARSETASTERQTADRREGQGESRCGSRELLLSDFNSTSQRDTLDLVLLSSWGLRSGAEIRSPVPAYFPLSIETRQLRLQPLNPNTPKTSTRYAAAPKHPKQP